MSADEFGARWGRYSEITGPVHNLDSLEALGRALEGRD
jgi:hypothetical protein